jgi:hypothetical protein
MLQNVGNNPSGADPNSCSNVLVNCVIPSYSSAPILNLSSSGNIRTINIKLADPSDLNLKNLRIHVRYDAIQSFSIDVPIAHFFGAGFNRSLYKSLPVGTDSADGYYSHWPMPFRHGILIELYNAGSVPITLERSCVEYALHPVSVDEAYLQAYYSEETTSSGQTYHQILSAAGCGHYVGNFLWIEKSTGAASGTLEGDDIINSDGNILYGTGLEDAYNGGYYYNWVAIISSEPEGGKPTFAIRPYYGLLQMNPKLNDTGGFIGFYRVDQYRWHIPDFVPFKNSLDVKIENYAQQGGITFGSVGFYYLFSAKPGDATGDDMVNNDDLQILSHYYGTLFDAVPSQGDFNFDGNVDALDLSILADNFE